MSIFVRRCACMLLLVRQVPTSILVCEDNDNTADPGDRYRKCWEIYWVLSFVFTCGVKTENDCGPIKRWKNSDRQVALATTFCMEAPNICVFSVWNLLPGPEDFHVEPRFLENLCTPGSVWNSREYGAISQSSVSKSRSFRGSRNRKLLQCRDKYKNVTESEILNLLQRQYLEY